MPRASNTQLMATRRKGKRGVEKLADVQMDAEFFRVFLTHSETVQKFIILDKGHKEKKQASESVHETRLKMFVKLYHLHAAGTLDVNIRTFQTNVEYQRVIIPYSRSNYLKCGRKTFLFSF